MGYRDKRSSSKINLHSTMVLFKFNIKINLYCLSIFTFHYGPIQMGYRDKRSSSKINLHSTMVLFKFNIKINLYCLSIFTFHYGPIQIRLYFLKPFQFFIYIPLWSYSNFATDDTNTNLYEIYIPLWSYSNE